MVALHFIGVSRNAGEFEYIFPFPIVVPFEMEIGCRLRWPQPVSAGQFGHSLK